MSARLRWVRQQVEEGAVAYFTFGSAATQGRGKVKIMIQHTATRTSPIARSLLLDALASVEKRAAVSSVVDRGHKHSNGCSEVALWFSDTATKVNGGFSSSCNGAPAPALLPADATDFAPPVGDMNAPSGLPLLRVSPPDLSGFADETAEPLVSEGSTRPMVLKSCLKPSGIVDGSVIVAESGEDLMARAKATLEDKELEDAKAKRRLATASVRSRLAVLERLQAEQALQADITAANDALTEALESCELADAVWKAAKAGDG